MEVEVARAVARLAVTPTEDRWASARRASASNFQTKMVETEIDVEDERPDGIGLDHVGVGAIVPTDGEAALRRVRRLPRTDGAGIDLEFDECFPKSHQS